MQRELKGQRCPGEEICARTGPLLKYSRSGQTPEQICDGCNLRHTKEQTVPLHLVNAINTALDLDEMERGGGRWGRDDLTAYEWACVRGLQRARANDEEKQRAKERAKAEEEAAYNRLRNNRRPTSGHGY